jgi:hypothetical protein
MFVYWLYGTLNKALFLFCFFVCANSGYILQYLPHKPHIYLIILISMIAGNLIEIKLPKTQSRKCLRKSNLWRYRAENVFGSLISMKLGRCDYQPTTCLNPRNFFLPRCLICTLPFKPLISLTFC